MIFQSRTYCTWPKSGQLIKSSVLKTLLNAFRPLIYFYYFFLNLDFLNDLCDFLYKFIRLLGFFLKFRLHWLLFFAKILDLLEIFDILNWIIV